MGYNAMAQEIFGREKITDEERSFVKHIILGPHIFAPGGPYGSKWNGPGPSPYDAAYKNAIGKGDQLLQEHKKKMELQKSGS